MMLTFEDMYGKVVYNTKTKKALVYGGESNQTENGEVVFASLKALEYAHKHPEVSDTLPVYADVHSFNHDDEGSLVPDDVDFVTYKDLFDIASNELELDRKNLLEDYPDLDFDKFKKEITYSIMYDALGICDWQDIGGYLCNEYDIGDSQFEDLRVYEIVSKKLRLEESDK